MSTPDRLREYLGLSESYWEGLGQTGRALYARIRPAPSKAYEIDVSLGRLHHWLDNTHRDMVAHGGRVELCPDFQRGHVWTETQRTLFCEAFVRGQSKALLLFNCPSYHSGPVDVNADLEPNVMQCVDGLQRLTALRDFAADKVQVFDGLRCVDLDGTPFDRRRMHVQVRIYSLSKRADLLNFYLDLNAGGTVHSDAELNRIRALRDTATATTEPIRRRTASARP